MVVAVCVAHITIVHFSARIAESIWVDVCAEIRRINVGKEYMIVPCRYLDIGDHVPEASCRIEPAGNCHIYGIVAEIVSSTLATHHKGYLQVA